MKRIMITGISGYLGTKLAGVLSKRRDVGLIIGADVVPMKSTFPKTRFYQADIRTSGIVEIMKENRIDTVLHLAFVVKPNRNRKLMHDVDFNGTRNVLEGAWSARVEHFVAVSSTLAYGAHGDNPPAISEADPLRGNESYPYGYNKALVDAMIQEFAAAHPEMTVTILRPCTVFGPAVDNYVSRMLFMPVVAAVRGHDPAVQFIHEDDFVSACIRAIDKRIPGAFNIAGDGSLTAGEIAAMIGTRVMHLPPWIIYPLLEVLWRLHVRGIDVNSGYLDYIRYPFVAAIGKAAAELGFKPKYSSRETLEETIRSREAAAEEKRNVS